MYFYKGEVKRENRALARFFVIYFMGIGWWP